MIYIDIIGWTIYYLLYASNPEFRESEKIKQEQLAIQQRSLIEIENQKYHRAMLDKKNSEIKKNQNLLENCFEDPDFCNTDPSLNEKIRDNIINPKFKSKFFIKLNNSFNETYYGCYCRPIANLNMSSICPVDSESLDSICKIRHSCIVNSNTDWTNSPNCDIDFEYSLNLISKKDDFPNTNEIIKKTIKKYMALLSLKKIVKD